MVTPDVIAGIRMETSFEETCPTGNDTTVVVLAYVILRTVHEALAPAMDVVTKVIFKSVRS